MILFKINDFGFRILDRLVLDSYEILIYILIIVIERIRDHQLMNVLDSNDYIDQQLGLDESRINKGIEKLSKLFNSNPANLSVVK